MAFPGGYGGGYVPAHPHAAASPPRGGALAHSKPAPPVRQSSALGLGAQYARIRWCAVHVDSAAGACVGALERIPKTDIVMDLSYENRVLKEIRDKIEAAESAQTELRERSEERMKKKAEREASMAASASRAAVEPPKAAFAGYGGTSEGGGEYKAPKSAKELKEDGLVSQLRMLHSGMDNVQARHFLEKYDWDMIRAAEAAYSAESEAEIISKKPTAAYGGSAMGYGMTSVLRVRLPDGRVFTYHMKADDSFWGVYGYVVESASDMGSRPFTFVLASGRRLTETDFDMTLSAASCVPEGFVSIAY